MRKQHVFEQQHQPKRFLKFIILRISIRYDKFNIKGNQRQFNVAIQFGDKITLRHKLSNKYLSYSLQFEQQQNDTTYHMQLSQQKSFFKILPCFQYQTKISSKIKFNQDIYIASQINIAKTGYISTRPMLTSDRKKTVLGLNYKSKFLLHSYYQLEKEETSYTFGSVVWLTHIECATFLTSLHNKQGKMEIMFENMQLDRDIQSFAGLWLLQSDKFQTGGKLSFQQKFMLKNLYSGAYLSFSKNYKLVDNQRVYTFTLQQVPSQQAKFVFKSLKGQDNEIRKGSYLILKNNQTNCYIGCRKGQTKSNNNLTKPLLYYDFSDQDLFKIIQLSQEECQAIQFIFSVREELKYVVRVVAKADQKLCHEVFGIVENITKQLNKLQKFDVYEKVQNQLIKYIQNFATCMTQFHNKQDVFEANTTSKKKQNSLTYMILKKIYQILKMICQQNRSNQQICWCYVHIFISDLFMNVGSQQLLISIYLDNYSLLCKVPQRLPLLKHNNIVKVIIQYIRSSPHEQTYWLNIQKIIRLFMTFIHVNDQTIDINQRLISEELFQNKLFDKVFFGIKIKDSKIKIQIKQSKNKTKFIDIEDIKDTLMLSLVQAIFQLLSSLCMSRNFIAKKAIDHYLNSQNKQGPTVLIKYLNLPISKRLLNHLYGLITNLYIDSCPRITRYRPLGVVNFFFESSNNRSEVEQAQMSARLKQAMLLKAEQSYRSRPLFISNLLSLQSNSQPTLSASQLDRYKDEISDKLISNRWSVQLLNSMKVMISLESYTVNQIISIFDMMTLKLLKKPRASSQIIVGIMRMYNEISIYNKQLELKKTTTYMKYKFQQKQYKISASDVQYLLPQSQKAFRLFGSSSAQKSQLQNQRQNAYMSDNESQIDATLNHYNNMQDILLRLYPTKQLREHLFGLFNDFESIDQVKSIPNLIIKVIKAVNIQKSRQTSVDSLQYLNSIFKTMLQFNQPKYYFLKNLMESIVITKDQSQTFDIMFQTYKNLTHLISITQYWLCSTNQQIYTQKFFTAMDRITNYFYQESSFDDKLSVKRDYKQININKQLVIRNLGFHVIIFELLDANFYLLQKKRRKQIQKKHLLTFQKAFSFLLHFIHQCNQNKQIIHDYQHVLNKYRDLIEVGQTSVYIELYKNHKDYIKQVQPVFVQKFVNKIVKQGSHNANNNTTLNNNNNVESINDKIDQCQFNPEFLRLLYILTVVDGKCYKPNLEKIFKYIQKQHIFRRIFFAQERQGKWALCLDMYKMKNDPLQIPFIYHVKILKIINLMLKQLQSISTSLKHRLQKMFGLNYWFEILSEIDIYLNSGIKAQLFFLVKKQVLVLATYFLDKNDWFLNYYQSQTLTKLLDYFDTIFVKKPDIKEFSAENQKFYIQHLQKYRDQIQYYRINQRVFYVKLILPFLSKLKTIYLKLQNCDKIKNYKKIIYLLQKIEISSLSQTEVINGVVRKNLSQIKIKWRNFVDDDIQNSQQQKFAKRTILQILRNSATQKLIQKQKQQFYKMIKMYGKKYIKGICKLLDLLMQKQLTQIDSQQHIKQIYEIFYHLESYLAYLTPKQIDQLTPTLQNSKFIQSLMDYCNTSVFDLNKVLFKKIFNLILKIFNIILINDEELRIHKTIYKYFHQNSQSYRFLSILNAAIMSISQRVDVNNFVEQVNNALGSLYLCVEQKKINLQKQGLQFITQLCSCTPFTIFLRVQPFYSSIDFLQKIFNSLNYILYQQKSKIRINVTVVSTAQQILHCISAMLTGGNKTNQSYIIDNKFSQIVNDVLRIQKLNDDQVNHQQLTNRNDLLKKVDQFYVDNGIEIGQLLEKQIKIVDFKHLYVLNRIKQALLRTMNQCIAGNQRVFSKIKIQIPIEFLKINLIWIYQDFINSKSQLQQNIILRKLQSWEDVVEQQNPNPLFLMIGFYFFMLIQCYSALDKNRQDEEDDMGQDTQKKKQKIIKKFFNSISDSSKKEDDQKSLQNQPFAQQMKLFYQKYYQSLQFFRSHTLTIQVNFFQNLTKVYFPKIPLCERLSQQRIQQFKTQAERISQQTKIKSLLEFADDVYEELQGEQDFLNKVESKYPTLAKVIKAMEYESQFLFIAWILSILLTFFFLVDDYYQPSTGFTSDMFILPTSWISTCLFIITILNLILAIAQFFYLFARKIPILVEFFCKKFEQQQVIEGLYRYKLIYLIFYQVYIGLCLIGTFIHPMMAGFIMTQILNRIQIGKQIIRSIRQAWFQLFIATCLMIIFNYFFSALIYVVYYVPYGPVCQSLYFCVLMLVDSAMKSGSGFLGMQNNTTFPDQNGQKMLYVVFACQVVFQIFSGTIIDKFSQLREESAQMDQDQQTLCYICGQQRFQIDFQLEGFQQHTEQTHNKINYVFYIFYLKRLQRKNYGIVQKYIDQCQMKDKKDWIPDGTSILKVQKQKSQQKQEQINMDVMHEKYTTKKLQQIKKIKQKTENIINELKAQ